MPSYALGKSFCWQGEITERIARLCRMFGLTADRLRSERSEHTCRLRIEPGDVVYITGPSGAGKSVLLRELEAQIDPRERINVSEIELSDDRAVIDCFEGDLVGALRQLAAAGLSEVFCLCKTPANLSEGQQWRFRLAQALAADKRYILADEFCSCLDRVTAAAAAYHVRRFATRTGTTFVLAGSHDDILVDLEPDLLVVKSFDPAAQVIYRDLARAARSRAC